MGLSTCVSKAWLSIDNTPPCPMTSDDDDDVSSRSLQIENKRTLQAIVSRQTSWQSCACARISAHCSTVRPAEFNGHCAVFHIGSRCPKIWEHLIFKVLSWACDTTESCSGMHIMACLTGDDANRLE
eukprot:6186459-Pleurochrysis_carterae.AAC.4